MRNPMRRQSQLTAVALALLGFAAPALAQTTSTVNFGTYVAYGDSLTAGYMSSSLVETHQRSSFPAQIGRRPEHISFLENLVLFPPVAGG